MKTLLSLLLPFLLPTLPLCAQTWVTENLNREWTYFAGDHYGAEREAFSLPLEAQTVGLPHSFSIPYFLSKDFYTGYGWYRKSIRLTEEEVKGCISLEFGGVFQEAEVYLNGQLAGRHQGGYTAFCIDLTPFARRGENLIAVRVNNLWSPVIAPRGGEHVFSGGIYRGVRLVKKQRLHLEWCGTVVTTPCLGQTEGKRSPVHVECRIANSTDKRRKCRIVATVKDAEGGTVCHAGQSFYAKAEATTALHFDTDTLHRPQLWDVDHPYLYTLHLQLYDGKKLTDEESIPFGFRYLRWTRDEGFFLNGQRLVLRGANVHQDQAGWGDAVTEEAARRDVRMVKEAGFNMIRGSHYPHSQAFVDECDRQGILFWSEAPFWGTAGPKEDGYWTASAYPANPADTAAFERSALQQLEEMIVQQRNHPAIFVWSMCNEPFFTAGGTMAGVKRLLRRMVDAAHALDPTRPAAIGGAQRPLGDGRIDLIGDVAGYNGDGANITDFQQPPVASMVSEYGSVSAVRPGRYSAGWGDLNRDEGWRGRPWRGGQAVWCAFDHGSIFGDELGRMGIIDYFRIPKRSWYWYRNEYRQVPPPAWPVEGKAAAVRLSASRSEGIKADGTDDVQLTATIVDAAGVALSNSPAVTFRVLSGPGEFPTGKSITFAPDSDIQILDGQAAIAFRAYYSGTTFIEASSEGLRSDTLRLTFTDAPAYSPNTDHTPQERIYKRYSKEDAKPQIYGRYSPTFASTSAEGHSAGMAADGELSTGWTPAPSDSAPWWMMDTERRLLVSRIKVTLTQAAHLQVELSLDGRQWTKVAEMTCTPQADTELPQSRLARFVRLSFSKGERIGVAEVEVTGKVK